MVHPPKATRQVTPSTFWTSRVRIEAQHHCQVASPPEESLLWCSAASALSWEWASLRGEFCFDTNNSLVAVTNDFNQVWHGSCRDEDDWYHKVEMDDLVRSSRLCVRCRAARKITDVGVRRSSGTTLRARALTNPRATTRNSSWRHRKARK